MTSMTGTGDGAIAEDEGAAPSGGGIDLHRLLVNKKRKLLAEQEADHEIHEHPTASGDAGEINWRNGVRHRFCQVVFVPSV